MMTNDRNSPDNAIARRSRELLERGYCVIPGLMGRERIAALDDELGEDFAETPFCTGGFYGARTKRFGRLLARSGIAAELVQHALVLGVVRTLLSPWCDTIQLNLTQALALHPGAPPQLPHRDQDMWRGAIGETEYLVNVMWPFTRYTEENGATVVWPNSHGKRALDSELPEGEFAVELEPGSALLFLGSTLHGAGANRSGARLSISGRGEKRGDRNGRAMHGEVSHGSCPLPRSSSSGRYAPSRCDGDSDWPPRQF